MKQLEYLAKPEQRSDTLVILMPGAGDDHTAFEAFGLIEHARSHQFPADIVTANSDYGYFSDLSIRTRLHEEVVLPAKAKGYRHIWMGGISLGGFGSMIYAQKHANELEGLLLIAPYLGNKGTLAEIHNAGGLDNWNPEVSSEYDERRIWQLLKQYAPDKPPRLPIHLLYGDTDRFSAFHQLLSSRLAKRYVLTVPGGHDWPVWQSLWQQFLATNPLATHSGGDATSSEQGKLEG
jgi:pimeloyl-ACP methyl ester carboxylesterase